MLADDWRVGLDQSRFEPLSLYYRWCNLNVSFVYFLQTSSPLSAAAQHIPVVMLQLFSYLYQSNFGFQTVCLSPEFLTGLIDLLVISNVCQACGAPPLEGSDEVCEFSWHRLEELLLSFLRIIVVDSFSLPPTAHRPVHVIDTVLEVRRCAL